MEMENFTILPLGSLFALRDSAVKLMTGPTSWSCCEAEMCYYKERAQNDLDR